MIHEVRDKWRILSNCPCGRSKAESLLQPRNGVNQLLNAVNQAITPSDKKPSVNGINSNQMNGSPQGSLSPLSLLADVASMDSENNKTLSKMKEALQEKLGGSPSGIIDREDDDADKKNPNSCATLRELLTKTGGKIKPGSDKKPKTIHSTLDDIIQQVVERNVAKDGDSLLVTQTLKHYIPRNGSSMQGRDGPIPCYTLTETSVLFPDVPHSWLDNGHLLRLHDPKHKGNLKLFQQQWRRALVRHCVV